jgi:putative lipoprotein (rSAM/lipoprotein system)
MKEIQTKFLKYSNAIIVGLLAILGFTSCGDPKDEYGTPSATFIVKGKVTSIETLEAIKNIKVIVHGDTSDIGYYWDRDTSVTDNDGNYVIDKYGFPKDQKYLIQFQDIDSVLNGQFQDLDTIIEFKNPTFSGGDGDWYCGEATKEFNIKLIPKK